MKHLFSLFCLLAARRTAHVVLLVVAMLTPMCSSAQDDDIFRSLNLGEVSMKKARSHAVRIYAYYRYWDDGVATVTDREFKLYRAYEGICAIDIRYGQDEDDGADIIAGRNLVHPDQQGSIMEFFELKPYTFLEKARRTPKVFTIDEQGDTTRVYARGRLEGTVVRDTLRRELRMSYNALSPDTSLTLNLLIIKARMSRAVAQAVYQMDDAEATYVPQGNLKHIVFEGNLTVSSPLKARIKDNGRSTTTDAQSLNEHFNERTEIYVDSVVYMTRDDYRADKKLTKAERRRLSGYADADIDRLKQKLHVEPLSPQQLEAIENQRDWDEAFERWKELNGREKP